MKNYLISTGMFEDNIYLDNYIDLINQNASQAAIKFQTNRHHIIPVNYFKRRNLSVDNSKANMVNLLFKDHILAHYYLCLCAVDKLDKCGNILAIQHLCGLSKKLNINFDINDLNLENLQELYTFSRKVVSENMKGRLCGDKNPAKRSDIRKKISKAKLGHEVSEETRQKLREKNLGQKRNPYNYTDDGLKRLSEQKLGDKNPAKRKEIRKINSEKHLGRIFITNGFINKTILPHELSEYISYGYRRGVTRGLHNK